MKTPHIILFLTAFVFCSAIVSSCHTVQTGLGGGGTGIPDPPAKYLLTFKQTLIDRAAFKAALRNARKNWQRDLAFNPVSAHDPVSDYTAPDVPSGATLEISLDLTMTGAGNPGSLHVTQRIGLNRRSDLDAVLAAVKSSP